ncbi:MAG: stalk domain-containing protein [Armatimonadota bacterium]
MRKLWPCLLLMLVALPTFAARDVYSARYDERGRVLVEMRPIFEALAATVEWIPSRQEIHARRGSSDMIMQINNSRAWVDGKSVQLEVPPRLVNGSTRVPLRFVAQSFGATVQYQGATVRIVTSDQDVLIVHLGAGFLPGGQTSGGFQNPGRAVAGNWPWTARRAVQPADLVGCNNWTLTLMRMEIEARHGRGFAVPALRDYFAAQAWYRLIPGYSDALLTPLERRNAQEILDYQNAQFGRPASKP